MQESGGNVDWFASPPRPDVRVIVAISNNAELSDELRLTLDRLRELLDTEVEGYAMKGTRISQLSPPEESRVRPFPRSWSR